MTSSNYQKQYLFIKYCIVNFGIQPLPTKIQSFWKSLYGLKINWVYWYWYRGTSEYKNMNISLCIHTELISLKMFNYSGLTASRFHPAHSRPRLTYEHFAFLNIPFRLLCIMYSFKLAFLWLRDIQQVKLHQF